MDFHSYIKRLKSIHHALLNYIDNTTNDDESKFIELIQNISSDDLVKNKQELKDFLYLISTISINHHITPDLFSKIQKIILKLKAGIAQNFSNLEIFNIFKKCKKLLLFLFNEKILIPDHSIYDIITAMKYKNMNYPNYFYLEFKDFMEKSTFSEEIELFEEKRKIGENEDYICSLIRNDSINEFVVYVNKKNILLDVEIENSIFETNLLLMNKKVSLIEYAAFYGSIQIFQFLKLNGVELNPLLWLYSIHGRNPELFHLLEESNVELDTEMKLQCLKESIKCHHNEFTEYILNQYYINDIKIDILPDKIKYRNFLSFPLEINEFTQSLSYLCKYDYYNFVKILLNYLDIDVNMTFCKETNDKKDGYEVIFSNYNGSQINGYQKCYKEQHTLLTISILKGNIEIVKLLMDHKDIDVNKKFTYVYSFLYNGVTSYMSGCGYKTPLFIAIENNNLEIVQTLLENKNIMINKESEYEKYSVERGGRLFMIKTPLHLAVENQNFEILKCLFNDKNININSIEKQNLEKLNHFEKTALHIAIEKGDEKIVQFLLDNGIFQSIDYKHTYFCHVCDSPSYFKNIDIKTSLQLAVQKINVKIVELLLKNENDINKLSEENEEYEMCNYTWKAALHMAIENESLDIINLLLSNNKIDVNLIATYSSKTYDGINHMQEIKTKTPLCIAVEKNNIKIVELLLKQKGIRTDIALNFDENITVLDFVEKNGNQKIIDLFKNFNK